MNKFACLTLLELIFLGGFTVQAQSETERLDLPGDNLNLYAVLRLFQKSPTLEQFETLLNAESSEINNLDLDKDNKVDYIRVSDNVMGKLHTITLKTSVTENDDQDIATIFVEQKDDAKVLLQMQGSEDLYGRDYIIEPQSTSTTKKDDSAYLANVKTTSSENAGSKIVAGWPIIQYLYKPNYSVWHSPWRAHFYPPQWRAWKPKYWHQYYAYHYHWQYYYNFHFRRWKYFRNPFWYAHYNAGIRTRSVIVKNRQARGEYKLTYSQPQSAQAGSALFRKKHPKSPGTGYIPPSFDKNGYPVAARPVLKKTNSAARKPSAKKKSTSSKTHRHSVKKRKTPGPSASNRATQKSSGDIKPKVASAS